MHSTKYSTLGTMRISCTARLLHTSLRSAISHGTQQPSFAAGFISKRVQTVPSTVAAQSVSTDAATSNKQTAGSESLNHYRQPPKEISDIVLSPPEPLLSFSPDRKLVMQLTRPPPHPPVSELAREELKLAGLRIDPESFSRSRMSYYTGMAFAKFTEDVMLPLNDGETTKIHGIPEGTNMIVIQSFFPRYII